jgi:hypothetical protein
LKYAVVKRWVAGERAEMDEDAIRSELETQMRELMELSGQRKFPGHRTLDTDRGHWKLAGNHVDRRGIKYQVYRCPMRHRCQCKISCRLVTGPDFIELQRHGLHDKDSHDNDGSKKLKYDQIVSVHEAAKTAPTLSGAVLRRNLLDHDSPTKTIPPQLQRCVQRIVQNVRKQVTQQHVDGFDLEDSFGSLHVLCVSL